MLLTFYAVLDKLGYVSGEEDGIVTIGGVPSSRQIDVFDAKTREYLQSTISNNNGNYLIVGLDPTKKYLLIARDYKQEYEPCCYDFVTPRDDRTLDEQMELWRSWQ